MITFANSTAPKKDELHQTTVIATVFVSFFLTNVKKKKKKKEGPGERMFVFHRDYGK